MSIFSFTETKKTHASVIKHSTDINLEAVVCVRTTQVFGPGDDRITATEIHVHVAGSEMPVMLADKPAEEFKTRWEEFKLNRA